MNYDLSFPKTKQRILILGDSFTFGPYLPNQRTFSGIIESRHRDKEIINAGVSEYTIDDELGLFVEKAKYLEPDITVLQVCDNDLYGMIFYKKQLFSRKQKKYQASAEEKNFFK
jgi:lysophospholipase L1-like esterase